MDSTSVEEAAMLNYQEKKRKNLKNPKLLAGKKINFARQNNCHKKFGCISAC